MAIPTRGEEFAKLIEYLRKAQETAAMLGHLHADENKHISTGYMAISELLERTVAQVTKIATGRMQ